MTQSLLQFLKNCNFEIFKLNIHIHKTSGKGLFYLCFCFVFLHCTFCIISIFPHLHLTISSFHSFFSFTFLSGYFFLLISFHASNLQIPYLCKITFCQLEIILSNKFCQQSKRFFTFNPF